MLTDVIRVTDNLIFEKFYSNKTRSSLIPQNILEVHRVIQIENKNKKKLSSSQEKIGYLSM